ncbi:MAG: glycoside hydrolase family 43 protein, partial [Alistipes sp.]|nr:glycoside hydrolase family 43 protein [Alistipes sp.]
IADPFVYQHQGVYYMTGTTASAEDQGFDYYTSTDLVTWKFCGALFRKGADHFGTGAFWAPEVKYYRGRFYMTYSCLDPKQGKLRSCLAVSDRPQGPFEELYTPWFDLGYSAIDCHIFVDKDRTPYLYFSKNGAEKGYACGENYVVQLQKDLSGFVGEPRLVSRASQGWERVNWDTNRCNEGAFVFRRGKTYYMTYSANDTGYSFYGIGVATAPHPLGPWTKYEENPLMTTQQEQGISSPGHNSIVASPDGKSLWIVYHRHARADAPKPSFDRVVCIDKLYFDKAGRLRVVGPTSTPQPRP